MGDGGEPRQWWGETCEEVRPRYLIVTCVTDSIFVVFIITKTPISLTISSPSYTPSIIACCLQVSSHAYISL